jgi:hypothetical protein
MNRKESSTTIFITRRRLLELFKPAITIALIVLTVIGIAYVISVLMAGATRLELATSGVTGRRSNQTELRPRK